MAGASRRLVEQHFPHIPYARGTHNPFAAASSITPQAKAVQWLRESSTEDLSHDLQHLFHEEDDYVFNEVRSVLNSVKKRE
jgi:hypothetical protein